MLGGLFPWRWTTDHFAGGKIAVIEMVMHSLYLIKAGFEMLSLGGNLSYRTFLFPSCLSLLQLLITQGGPGRKATL